MSRAQLKQKSKLEIRLYVSIDLCMSLVRLRNIEHYLRALLFLEQPYVCEIHVSK